MSITFDEKDVRPVGRTAQGVIGIRLDEDDSVIGMESIISNIKGTLLAITENGFGKRTELEEYRVQNRGGRGVITYKVTPKTGDIVGIRIATDEEDVMLITDNGTIIRLNVKDISILGRATQGVTLMRTNEGKVVSIEKYLWKKVNNMMNFKKDSVNPIMLLIENLGEISILADEVVDNPDVISDNQEREILTDIYGKFMKENMELIIEITKSSEQEEGYKNVEEISKFFIKDWISLKQML